MNFGEKIKMLRKQKGLSQAELGKLVHVSARSITAYETSGAYPRKMGTYELLAKALDTDVNYLRTENEEMMSDIGEKYGTRGQRQMEALKSQVSALFAGGELNEEEQMAFLMDLNDIFLDAKKKAKKYTPKKYRE
jgi:transcriptional regulator with XRE-family HTH domain